MEDALGEIELKGEIPDLKFSRVRIINLCAVVLVLLSHVTSMVPLHRAWLACIMKKVSD